MSASQRHYPSTIWREQVLDVIATGVAPALAIREMVSVDAERGARQLVALDRKGRSGTFAGSANLPEIEDQIGTYICVGGNM